MLNIKYFQEINDLFEATGFQKRTNIPEFYILKFEELTSESTYHMPPYQKDFYQIGFIVKSPNSTEISIDHEGKSIEKNTLFFVSPDHVYSWIRSDNITGFLLYFKKDFLNFYRGQFRSDFPFFDVTNQNVFSLDTTSSAVLKTDLDKLHLEYHTNNLYRFQVIQSSLLAFLFKIKSLEQIKNVQQRTFSIQEELTFRFENLVKNTFKKSHKVQFYASLLHVSESHLNHTLKKIKQKSAKEIIADQILKQAKTDLKYSRLSISEIAFNCGFSEPTHFTRFFKKHTKQTPMQYRNQSLY